MRQNPFNKTSLLLWNSLQESICQKTRCPLERSGCMSSYLSNKKPTSKSLAKEIELKKKNCLKENGSMNVLGLVNKPTTNNSKIRQKQQIDHQKLTVMVKDYRKKVGSKTGGIKLYDALIGLLIGLKASPIPNQYAKVAFLITIILI